MRKVNHLAFLVLFGVSLGLLTASPAEEVRRAVPARAQPDPAAIMDQLYTPGRTTYKGQLVMNQWTDQGTRAEDVRIFFTPPDKYRFEFLKPSGELDRVVLTSNQKEEVQIYEDGKLARQYVTKHPAKMLARDQEKKLLLSNYKVNTHESEDVLGRPVWTLEFVPLAVGKPVHKISVDRMTFVVLETKKYAAGGNVGSLTRFTRFEPNASLPKSLFLADEAEDPASRLDGVKVQSSPLTKEESAALAGLYGGFSIQSVDRFDYSGKSVTHIHYTDGLVPLSIFQTPVAIRIPGNSDLTSSWGDSPMLTGASHNRVYSVKRNDQYLTLIGDVPQQVLEDIARRLE